eukprot:GHUV01044768.1.p1 GENE.GHUV01044768.1~~GHUV01044768.1.p1  ORF type:complete len:587 (+),score=180.53 GHUV01044768.1:1086-2846(+)
MALVSELEVVESSGGSNSSAGQSSKPDAVAATPAKQQMHVKQEQENTPPAVTPAFTPAAAKPAFTPGPTPSPSEQVRTNLAMTPATGVEREQQLSPLGLTPSSTTPVPVGSRARVQPIKALNPYDTQWTIKAKLVRKAPPRSFNSRAGAPSRVFNVELADAEGGQIQGTFWRESADKYLDTLQEGKVYYFSKFQVKPANKQYATVKNDYELHFDNRTEVEEAADQSGITVSHQVDVVPFDKLLRYVGRKMPVDILGVVVSCGGLGTIKRKADQTELPRRDVTLADSSGHSVVLTLWADQAQRSDLDGCEGQVMQVTCVRVGDYNGCSLSAVTRSQVTLNPEGEAADALRQWWESEGRDATLTPLGQATGGIGGASGAGPRQNKLQFLQEVVAEDNLPSPDAKPTYHDVIVNVMQIKEDQTMYYLANPDNGKKVEPRDGRYWCEADSRFVDVAGNRYVLTARVADATRECYVNMFNEQGNQLMGSTADELAALRNSDEAEFNKKVKAAKWTEWTMTLAARSREYNGERRMRYTVARVSPLSLVDCSSNVVLHVLHNKYCPLLLSSCSRTSFQSRCGRQALLVWSTKE